MFAEGPILIPREHVRDLRAEQAADSPTHDNPVFETNADGSAMAYLEVFRNLACLNLLSQHTYRKEYDYAGLVAFQGAEDTVMARVDGCVQRLRRVLMCAGDTTPYPIMLTPEKTQKESPDFNTLHNCRNFDRILEWTRENEVETEGADRFPPLHGFVGS